MVPVRWCAGIASALLMLFGSAAVAAALARNWRKLRRSVIMEVLLFESLNAFGGHLGTRRFQRRYGWGCLERNGCNLLLT
jgi:hypothetical protein